MTFADAQNADRQTSWAKLLEGFGHPQWRERQDAVLRVARDSTPGLIAEVLGILRHGHRDLARLNAAMEVLKQTEVDVVPSLVELLHESDADMRAYTALTLGERGDPRATEALRGLLSDPDTNVRVHAIEALGKLRAYAAVDELIGFVESQDFELAFPALDALRAIGDARVASRLLPLLANPLFAQPTIEALGALGDEEAIPPLLNLLAADGSSVGAIALAIRQMHQRLIGLCGSTAVAKTVRLAGKPKHVEVLGAVLAIAPPDEAAAMVALLGWLPGAEAESLLLNGLDAVELQTTCAAALAGRGPVLLPALLAHFELASSEARPALAELCGTLGDRRALPSLLACLDDGDDVLVAKALDALSRLGDARVYAPASRLLGHDDARVRSAAVGALNALGDAATARDMLTLLHDPHSNVRESALKVAAYFGFAECQDAIFACCDDADERVRRTALELLPCLDDKRVLAALAKALTTEIPPIRAAAAGALGEVESPLAVELLGRALGDDDLWVRYFAARSLRGLDVRPETASQLLALATSDPAVQVRIAALDALTPNTASELAILDILSDNSEIDVACAALAALGRSRHLDALPTLVVAARSEEPRKRLAAIQALGISGLPETIKTLQQVARNRDQVVSSAAVASLASIHTLESVATLLSFSEIPRLRTACIAALTRLGATSVSFLACHLQQLSLSEQMSAVEVLLRNRSQQAIAVLETALIGSAPAVRYGTLTGLAHLACTVIQTETDGGEGDA